jgi:hypothetical protein
LNRPMQYLLKYALIQRPESPASSSFPPFGAFGGVLTIFYQS